MGKFVTVKSGRTLYIHDTPGDNGTIVAAHGLTGNHKQLHFYEESLSGTYRFISYDLSGRGNSDAADPDTSIYSHADDFIDLIDTLKIERPILMGYSMGAYIAAIAASRLKNVAGLVLLDGAGEPDEATRDLVLPSLNRLKKSFPSPESYVEETKQLYQNLNIEWNDRLVEIAQYEIKKEDGRWAHKSDYSLTKKDFESFYDFSPGEIGPSIASDTLLVIATGAMKNKQSLFKETSYTETRKSIRHLQTIITSVNHYELVFNRQPDLLADIETFLARKEVKS